MARCLRFLTLSIMCVTGILQAQTSISGVLYLNTGYSFCMDGCDEFYIEPDTGYEFSWITTFGNLAPLIPCIAGGHNAAQCSQVM